MNKPLDTTSFNAFFVLALSGLALMALIPLTAAAAYAQSAQLTKISCNTALDSPEQTKAQILVQKLLNIARQDHNAINGESSGALNSVQQLTAVSELLTSELNSASDQLGRSLSGRNEATEIILTFKAHHDLADTHARLSENLKTLMEALAKKDSDLHLQLGRIFGKKAGADPAEALRQIAIDSRDTRILLEQIRAAIPKFNTAYAELKKQREDLEKSFETAVQLKAELDLVGSEVSESDAPEALNHAQSILNSSLESMTLLRAFADEHIRHCERQTAELLRLESSASQQINVVTSSIAAVQRLKIPDAPKPVAASAREGNEGPSINTHKPERTNWDKLLLRTDEKVRTKAAEAEVKKFEAYILSNQDKLTMPVAMFLNKKIGDMDVTARYIEENGQHLTFDNFVAIVRNFNFASVGRTHPYVPQPLIVAFANARARSTGILIGEWKDKGAYYIIPNLSILEMCDVPGNAKHLGWQDIHRLLRLHYSDPVDAQERIIKLIGKLHASGNLTREEALEFKNSLLSKGLQDKLEYIVTTNEEY